MSLWSVANRAGLPRLADWLWKAEGSALRDALRPSFARVGACESPNACVVRGGTVNLPPVGSEWVLRTAGWWTPGKPVHVTGYINAPGAPGNVDDPRPILPDPVVTYYDTTTRENGRLFVQVFAESALRFEIKVRPPLRGQIVLDVSAYAVGETRAGRLLLEGTTLDQLLEYPCAEDVRGMVAMIEQRVPLARIEFMAVNSISVWPAWNGKGLGLELYDRALAGAMHSGRVLLLVPGRCDEGSTSPDAERIWTRLRGPRSPTFVREKFDPPLPPRWLSNGAVVASLPADPGRIGEGEDRSEEDRSSRQVAVDRARLPDGSWYIVEAAPGYTPPAGLPSQFYRRKPEAQKFAARLVGGHTVALVQVDVQDDQVVSERRIDTLQSGATVPGVMWVPGAMPMGGDTAQMRRSLADMKRAYQDAGRRPADLSKMKRRLLDIAKLADLDDDIAYNYIAALSMWFDYLRPIELLDARLREARRSNPPSPRAQTTRITRKLAQVAPEVRARLALDGACHEDGSCPPTTGMCYPAAEVLFWSLGGDASGLHPYRVMVDGGSHWFLADEGGVIYDPTAGQYGGSLDYASARPHAFLTRAPSRRAVEMATEIGVPLLRQNPATFHPTAMGRTNPSAPLRHLAEHAPDVLTGDILDFGSGRGADAEALGATAYDPYHPDPDVRMLPAGQFDLVLALYVLNVLPSAERHRAIATIKGKVRRGGYLFVAVRPEAEIERATEGWTERGDGHETAAGGEDRFQRGYTRESLLREIERVTPGTWSLLPLPALAGAVVALLRRDR